MDLFLCESSGKKINKEIKLCYLQDRLLAELLTSQKDYIVQYHKHDSLLENQLDQELTEEERKAAWEEYEQEKKGPPLGGMRKQTSTQMFLVVWLDIGCLETLWTASIGLVLVLNSCLTGDKKC